MCDDDGDMSLFQDDGNDDGNNKSFFVFDFVRVALGSVLLKVIEVVELSRQFVWTILALAINVR